MKKTLLIPFFVALTFLLVGFVSASGLSIDQVKFNSMILDKDDIERVETTNVDSTVPVLVIFSTKNASSEVEVEVELEGKEDVSVSKEFGFMEKNSRRSVYFNLEIPSSIKTRSEEYKLIITISSTDSAEVRETYFVKIQRNSDELSILSIDYNTQVTAGDVFPVSVVIKNTGYDRGDDNYIVASIPSLSVSSRNYAGDLITTEDDIDNDDKEDSVHRIVYLKVPEDAPAGVYDLIVTAYNDDAKTEITKLVSIEESQTTTVLAATKSQDISAGEIAQYDLIIVNTADTAKVFQIDSVSSKDLIISAPIVVAVGAGETETVTIEAHVPEGTEKGIYTFSINVEGKQVVFAANVVSSTSTVSSSIVGLTVVLVIVFVVLLAVLIILISRKDNTVEEVETSYY